VQAQISAADNARYELRAGAEPAAAGPRDERDCPHCAERILARARVCKHCGRDVEPLVTT
jgi:DNA-directed RNA polymerase subunit RPC12/RpoP